jgi:hypothetical protein
MTDEMILENGFKNGGKLIMDVFRLIQSQSYF